MSTEDGEAGTLRVGHWVTDDEDDPAPAPAKPARPVALPAAVAVAALLIVVTVIGGSLAHERADRSPTWVAGPAPVSSAPPPSPGVSVKPAPPTFTRRAVSATRPVTPTTRRPPATTTTKVKPPPPTPSCTRGGWPPRHCWPRRPRG